MQDGELRAALRVVLPYVVVAGGWIFFSDAALLWLTSDAALVNRLQTAKGLLFVAVTAGLLMLLLARELRRRHTAEAALSASQRFAAQVADAMPGLLYIYDLAGQRNVYLNHGVTTVLGYSADRTSALGDVPLQALTHPDDERPLSGDNLAGYAAVHDGEAVESTIRMRHADGGWRWLQCREVIYARDEQGRPRQVLGAALDITRQKAAEDRLRESERRFRVLTEASPAGLFQTDAQGRQTYVNERWCQITGLSLETGLGRDFLGVVHPDDRDHVAATWEAAVRAGRPAEAEFRLQRPDGAVIWVLSRVVDERDQAGDLMGFLGTVVDITALKQAEARAQRLARVYAVLSDINQVIVRVRERGRLFEAACRIAVEAGGLRMAWIGQADSVTGRLAVIASAGVTDGYLERLEIRLGDEPRGRGPSGAAARLGRNAISNDIERDERMAPWRADALRLGYRSTAAFPLVVFGQVWGVLTLYADEVGFFDAEEVRLLDELALDLSFALEFMEREIQRERVESALQASEARFRAFFEHAPVYCCMVTPDGLILDVNNAICAALGYTRAELVGARFIQLYAPAARARAQALFEQWRATGRVADEELRVQTKTGAERVVLLSAEAVRDAAGQILYSISLQRDITERVQAEAALRESEARYRLLADNVVDVVWLLDTATQRFTYVSPSVTRLRGYSVEAVLAQSLEEVLTPASLAMVRESLPARVQAFLAGDPAAVTQRHEIEQTRQDGSTVWTEVITTLVRTDAGGLEVLGVSRDIAERKQAEAALAASEAQYRGLFENMLEGVAYCRMIFEAGVPQDWVYLQVNRSFETLTGLRDIVGRRVTEAIPGIRETSPDLFEIYGRVALTGQPEKFETFVPALEMWFAVQVYRPEPGHFVAMFDVITERKRAEAALQRTSETLQAVVAASPLAIMIVDAAGLIQAWNPASERIFGWPASDVLGRRAARDAPEQGADYEALAERALAGETITGHEVRCRRQDGGTVEISVSAAALRGASGQAAGLLFISEDITERKRQAAAIEQHLTMLNALYAQAHQLTQTRDPAQVAASVARQCVETFGARLAWLGVAEPDGRVEVLAHFPLADDYPRQVRVRWDTAPEGFGPTGRALRERGPIISTNLAAPAYASWRSAVQGRGFRASAAFPLLSQEQPLGALNLYSDRDDFFSAERVALFQAFAQQAAAALANARLFQSVTEQREQLRGLAVRISEVEEAERRRLARELHDQVGANLTALNISLTLVRGQLSAETQAAVGSRLDDALKLLQETMVQVRDVMMGLRPSVLDDYGLLAALRWYVEQLSRRSGQAMEVVSLGPEPRLPAAVETALFRLAQEALTNIIKHARASRVELRLETDAGRVRLAIADDGVGFDPGRPQRGGWGMKNMRERVEALGGRLQVEARPGQGVQIIVEVAL